jgi:PPOX class probable F420-dependent enzyme
MATIPESHADLLTGTVTLVTLGPDGYPQATAITAHLDGGRLHTSVNDTRQKYKNMLANPKATVFAIDPANPYRTIEVRADVELVLDVDKQWTRAVRPNLDVVAADGDAARYHVILTPIKVNAFGDAGR